MQNSAIGSGFAGFMCAVIAIGTNQFGIMQTAFVASFGSKLSDTVSSEVGKGAAAMLPIAVFGNLSMFTMQSDCLWVVLRI